MSFYIPVVALLLVTGPGTQDTDVRMPAPASEAELESGPGTSPKRGDRSPVSEPSTSVASERPPANEGAPTIAAPDGERPRTGSRANTDSPEPSLDLVQPPPSADAADSANRREPVAAARRDQLQSGVVARERLSVESPSTEPVLRTDSRSLPRFDGDRRRARELQRGGALALTVGGLLAVGGVLMAAVPACAPKAGNSCSSEAQWRAVATLSAPAAVLLVGGATMLSLGIYRYRQLTLTTSVGAGRYGGEIRVSTRF